MAVKTWSMVLGLDGYSELAAHLCSEIGNLVCLRHFFRSRAVASLKLLQISVFSFTRAQYVLSYFAI